MVNEKRRWWHTSTELDGVSEKLVVNKGSCGAPTELDGVSEKLVVNEKRRWWHTSTGWAG